MRPKALPAFIDGIAIMAKCQTSDIGSMNKRVIIQAVTQSADSQGGFTETWATYKTVWAAIKPISGGETFQASQYRTPVTHKITMRYLPSITTKHRILYGSRVFAIKEIIDVDDDNYLLVMKAIEQQ